MCWFCFFPPFFRHGLLPVSLFTSLIFPRKASVVAGGRKGGGEGGVERGARPFLATGEGNMKSLPEEASFTPLLDRLLLTEGRNAKQPFTVSSASADILQDTDTYGISLLASLETLTRTRRNSSVLLWLDGVARRQFRWRKKDATAQRLFRWASRQLEKREALKSQLDPVKDVSFQPAINGNFVIKRHEPHVAHEDLVQLESRRFKQLEEKNCNQPWQMSTGPQKVLQVRGTMEDGEVECRRSGENNDDLSTSCYNKGNSHRILTDYPPLLERMQDDIAVRRQRAAECEDYARSESAALRQVADQISQPSQHADTKRELLFEEDVTFTPKINGEIFSPPDRPLGVSVAFASSFQLRQEGDAGFSLAPRRRPPPAMPKARAAFSPIRMEAFCERQRLCETRRREYLRCLGEEINARREEEEMAECTFHPKVNASALIRTPSFEETRTLSMRVPFGALEYKSPTQRRPLDYKDINELRLRQPRLSKTPASANKSNTHVQGRGNASLRGRAASRTPSRRAGRRSYAALHTPRQDDSKRTDRSNVMETSPVTSRASHSQKDIESGALDLDEQTLLDLSIWWKDILMQELEFSCGTCENREDDAFDPQLHEWALETPFTCTLASQTVIQALQELMNLSTGESDAMAPERIFGNESSWIQTSLQQGGRVTFAQFIELYKKLLHTK
ncbi:hypothetical protein MOQ_001318 [Trypanosoma cruzi marinkellei]|uniref:Uncharacterized protein n=1 Tax=Trypanosoma cruzi marinkellei TaxID=85056 RepID=K2MT90_TRYCR|nr:hypothetical protein MOQ_001318 [Trypanosoma cruzi marinkellei]